MKDRQEQEIYLLEQELDNLYELLDKMKSLLKMNIQECIDNDDCYRARVQMENLVKLLDSGTITTIKEGKYEG